MTHPSPAPSRRMFLRGLGATLALPWLPSLQGAVASGPATGPARHVVFYYFPVGVIPSHFLPETTGLAWTPSGFLAPMERHRSALTVVSGLRTVDVSELPGDAHEKMATTILTGDPLLDRDQVGPDGGRSADQFLAYAMQDGTRFTSLEVASQGEMPCLPNQNCAFREHISWDALDRPRSRETSPERFFERLFGASATLGDAAAQARRVAERRSVLDFTRDSARRIQAHVSREDRERLDEYFTSVRAIELGLDARGRSAACAPSTQLDESALAPDVMTTGLLVDLMHELMALALQCDQTHVLTYMLANEGSQRAYPELGVPDSHHFASHYGASDSRRDATNQICTWEAGRYAAFLDRLDAVPGAQGGSLLDETLVVGFAGMGDPDRHDHRELPVVLAGAGGHDGSHLRFEDRPFSDLLLDILQRQGVSRKTFGREGTTPLGLWSV